MKMYQKKQFIFNDFFFLFPSFDDEESLDCEIETFLKAISLG